MVALHHICLGVIDDMKDSRKTPLQLSFPFQIQQTFPEPFHQPVWRLSVLFRFPYALWCLHFPGILGCSHQGRQNLTGAGSLPHHQMTQIPLMTLFMEIRNPAVSRNRPEIIQHSGQNQPVVFIYNAAVLYRHHIIKTAPLVHTQCKGAVLSLVSE